MLAFSLQKSVNPEKDSREVEIFGRTRWQLMEVLAIHNLEVQGKKRTKGTNTLEESQATDKRY
jgi:hypothetical protein